MGREFIADDGNMNSLNFLKIFFMWIILKVFIEVCYKIASVLLLLLLASKMWDPSFLTKG